MSASNKKAMTVNWLASLMVVQSVSRLVHFLLNALVIRVMTPSSYAFSSIQLPFVTMSITKLLKEALHRAAVKSHKTTGTSAAEKASNLVLVWWSIPLGTIISLVISLFYLYNSTSISENPWMIQGLFCWLFSSWMELLIEPVIIFIESTNPNMNVVVAVDCISLLVHSGTTVLMLLTLDQEPALLLSIGQLIFSTSLVVGYYLYALWWDPTVISKIWPSSFSITSNMLNAFRGFTFQSFEKYVMAEGENAILFFYGTPEQQGVYGFITNLGSIVARIAFLSLEKTGFVMFNRLHAEPAERRKIWTMLLNVSMTVALLYLATCPPYIAFIIKLVYEKWSTSDAAPLLGWYGFYLLLIGVNGLVESHRDALAPDRLIEQQKLFIVTFTSSFCVIGAVLVYHYGAAGLLFACCLRTLVKLYYNMNFFRDYVFPLRDGLPSIDVWIVCALLFVTATISRQVFGDTWKHFGFGVLQAALLALWLLIFQRNKLKATASLIRNKNKPQDKAS